MNKSQRKWRRPIRVQR